MVLQLCAFLHSSTWRRMISSIYLSTSWDAEDAWDFRALRPAQFSTHIKTTTTITSITTFYSKRINYREKLLTGLWKRGLQYGRDLSWERAQRDEENVDGRGRAAGEKINKRHLSIKVCVVEDSSKGCCLCIVVWWNGCKELFLLVVDTYWL